MSIFISLILATIRQAAPILITAIGGMFSELTGVVNIGLEGMMLMGAFSAAVVSYYTGNPYIGILGGMMAGGIMAFLHALLSIKYKGNQVVSGVAINMFASGCFGTGDADINSENNEKGHPRDYNISLLLIWDVGLSTAELFSELLKTN